jgi:two-component system NarL family sensor kinase
MLITGTLIMVVTFAFIVLFLVLYERKRSAYKAELNRIALEHQKKLLEAIITTQENEKQEFAAELHDSLSQILTTQLLALYHLEATINDKSSNTTEHIKIINSIKHLSKQSITETKNISLKLMPVVLNDFGLIDALSELTQRVYETKNININFSRPTVKKRYMPEIEHALYRISQELINNTLKYANAKNINLQIKENNDTINFYYADDGIGFNVEEKVGNGIGLLSMQSRISAVNGSIQFESALPRGFSLHVIIPNPKNKETI